MKGPRGTFSDAGISTFARVPLSRLSLRFKITAGFVLVVLCGAAVSTYIGSKIITDAMFEETLKRVRTGLQATRMMYEARLDSVRQAVVLAASRDKLLNTLQPPADGPTPELLTSMHQQHGLDFLGFAGRDGKWVTLTESVQWQGEPRSLPSAVAAAWAGEVTASAEVFEPDALAAESPELAKKAFVPISQVWGSTRQSEKAVERGLVFFAAAPVRESKKIAGVLYGGLLVNRTTDLVDQIKVAIFGGETYEREEVGAVTIFLDDLRVSTTIRIRPGERAIGTRVSDKVAEAVLKDGHSWSGRAFVVNDWYVAAYEPIKNRDEKIIGMLYVGMREGPYLAVRTRMMLTFLVVVVFGLFVVAGFAYIFTRTMIRPLEEMVAASKLIAAGDLGHTVHVRSGDEIGHLAYSFNKMVASLKAMKKELEDSARTLEERVEERTKELIAMQASMAQSEKLAAIGRMAAGVAHEINNPLGGILTFAMLALEDSPPDQAMRQKLDIVVKQTLRCRDIVKRLLDFARQSETAGTLTEINPVIENTLSLLEKQAIFQNIQIERRLCSGSAEVFVDPSQLQQVIINLAMNAADAMEDSGILTVETKTDGEQEQVLIRVADTGKGIPPEIMPLIFEPFFTTKEVGKGTGLGLAIVHGIVTRVGGSIKVSSSKSGTAFAIRLPRGSRTSKEGET